MSDGSQESPQSSQQLGQQPLEDTHIDFGHTDFGHSDFGHFDFGHSDSGHFDFGHSDSGRFDFGHSDSGHNDIVHIDFVHEDSGHDDVVHVDFGHIDLGRSFASETRATVEHVNTVLNNFGQALALRDTALVVRHQQLAQGVDQMVQWVGQRFGDLTTATNATFLQLQQRINELEAQVTSLQARLAALEQQRGS